jgi:hypothetical protein
LPVDRYLPQLTPHYFPSELQNYYTFEVKIQGLHPTLRFSVVIVEVGIDGGQVEVIRVQVEWIEKVLSCCWYFGENGVVE